MTDNYLNKISEALNRSEEQYEADLHVWNTELPSPQATFHLEGVEYGLFLGHEGTLVRLQKRRDGLWDKRMSYTYSKAEVEALKKAL